MGKRALTAGRPPLTSSESFRGPEPENGNQANNPRVGGYVRVSQERQVKNGYGLDSQVTDVQRYAKFRGWETAKIYMEKGVSGYKKARPALDQLLADARAGKLDVVIFPSIDRAARSVRDMIEIDTGLRESNVIVIFAREGVDTSKPIGQFFRNICASLAQFEGKLIYERLTKGRERKAAKGGYTGGWLPYGYRLHKHRVEVVKEEASAVRLIYTLRLQGRSFREIVDELNRRELKTAKGGPWRFSTVQNIVHNIFYAGYTRLGDEYVRGSHQPIISVERFNKTQEVLQAWRTPGRIKPRAPACRSTLQKVIRLPGKSRT